MDTTIEPPDHPPPLLSRPDIIKLARQGYLNIQLAPHLQTLYEQTFVEADRFFVEPDAAKRTLYPLSPEGTNSEGGYARVEGEKEYLTLRHRTTSQLEAASALERLAVEVWHDTGALLHRVLVDLARVTPALTTSTSPDVLWDPILEGSLDIPATAEEAMSTPTILRLFRYEPGSGTSERHTDVGLLTLCVCSEPGLQVYSTADGGPGRWVDCGFATLLVGNTLRALTGHRVRSGLHRVVATPEGRRSIVFALRPSLRSSVDFQRLGGPPDVTVLDVWTETKKGRFNVNARPEEREKQKKVLRLERGG